MKKTRFLLRLSALFLVLCTLVGLLPAVTVFPVSAEESADSAAIATETQERLTYLRNSYNGFGIPQTKARDVDGSSINSLDGTYFLVILDAGNGKGENIKHRTIDFSQENSSQFDRLSGNCYGSSPSDGADNNFYPSLWVTVGNYASKDATFDYINDRTPDNLLDYAVELRRYTGTILYNTTISYNEGSNTPYSSGQGWQDYNRWEFYRTNLADGDYSSWGPYFGIDSPATAYETSYSIKSLHPSHASAPYLACSGHYGAVTYLNSAMPFFLKSNTGDNTGVRSFKMYKVDNAAGSNVYSYWLGVDTYYSNVPISAHTLSQIVREDKNQNTTGYPGHLHNQFATDWELIQVSPLTLELYKSLYRVKNHVLGENSQGKYAPETYLGFLRYAEEAMREYNAYRYTFTLGEEDTRTRLESMGKDLESWMARLDIEAEAESYLDVPVEILDFRADGLLFEGWNQGTAYSLASDSPAVGNEGFPGNPLPGDNGPYYVEGLIEPTLKNGQIIYKPETISYIANALNKQHHTFADTSISGFTTGFLDPKWNNVFMDMVSHSGAPLRLGSWEETKKDIDTGENGGILLFSKVDSCYDLAYYMLTNIWRQTDPEDIVDQSTGLPYNIKVDEIQTLRLVKNKDGMYSFASDYENGRNLETSTIYNYPYGLPSGPKLPTLNAISDLGFESPSMLGHNSTGGSFDNNSLDFYGRRNYHSMYHMASAFVYYESKNLEFTFSGDDDVYFFINGELICDIGGMHVAVKRRIELNGAIAKKLGLEDGDICSFDMFLAERHTSAINLNFTTNIEMMPSGAVTEKVQYFYTAPGIPETEIREGAAVPDETEVGYGFKLLNQGSYGVKELTFEDKTLGVDMSGAGLKLGNYGKLDELTFVYTTRDSLTKRLCTDMPQILPYDTLEDMLEDGIAKMTTIEPLEDGVYVISDLTEDQIERLLTLGLPANVQLAIYGFHRTVYSNPGTYTNTVYTTCVPIKGRDSVGNVVYGNPLPGIGRRTVKVLSMETVFANSFRAVLDYGKPLDITTSALFEHLSYNPDIANVSFMGVRLGGEHNATTPFKPSYLYLEKEGETLSTENGIYERRGDTIRFTPHGFLEGADRLYAFFRVIDTYVSGEWYLTMAMDILPANIVYYEAESYVGKEIQTLKKEGDDSSTWIEPVTDGLQDPEGESQDLDRPADLDTPMVADRDYIPGDSFFVDFDGKGYAQRYQDQPQYAGVDFDKASSWSVYANGTPDSRIVGVDTTAGTLTFEDAAQNDANGDPIHWNYIHSGTNDGEQILRYAVGEKDYLQIRMKIQGGAMTGDTFTLSLEKNNGQTATYYGIGTFGSEYMDGNYHVFTVPLNHDTYKQIDTLTSVRPVIHWTQGCTFTVDYIYVGPEQGMPHETYDYEDYLFFDFNGNGSDALRYQLSNYGGVNFGLPASWDTPADTSGLQITGGMAILEDLNRDTTVRWDYMETKGSNNMPLSYKVTQNDVLQVRLKIEGGGELAGYAPQARVEVMTPNGLKHAGHVEFNYNTTSRPGLMNVVSGQYYTFTIPLNDPEYLNLTTLQSVRFVIYNIEGTDSNGAYDKYTIDYIYVGPKHLTEVPRQEKDHLLFDFTNTNRDILRYSHPVYGTTGNNYGELAKWATDSSTLITGMDTAAGTITFKDNHNTADYNFIQPGATNGEWSLNFKPGKNDVFQVRMKVTQGSTSNSSINVRMECNKGNGVIVYGQKNFSSAYMDGKYHVFTVPLGDVYKNLTTLDGFRLVLLGMQNCTFTVDYIYVGPLKESNPSPQSLYFDFENLAADRERYDSKTYGYINFDRWEKDNDSDRANWASAYGASETQAADGTNGDKFEINNRAGTITVYPGSVIADDGSGSFRTDLQPTLTYKNYQFSDEVGMPLFFRPDRAEVIRVRLRLENCVAGGNEEQGDTPYVEIGVNYQEGGVRKVMDANTYTANIDVTTGDYQTLTIPVGDLLGKAELVEGITLRFFHIKNAGEGKIVIDDIYMGPGEIKEENQPVYGYDSTYAEDGELSDGKSLFVEGNGVFVPNAEVNNKYTEATFSFTGTGFDIISRTGKDQATIRVAVYDDPAKTEEDRIKALTVNGKGELELYQIPTVSVQGLPHGTYYVTIWVNDKLSAPNIPGVDLSMLARGNHFYFDALRIYDPIDVSGELLTEEQLLAMDAYLDHGEAYQYIKEVRNILLSKEIFDTLEGTLAGALFVDMETTPEDIVIQETDSEGETTGETTVVKPEGVEVTDHVTAKVQTYNKVGPKNEVYLAPGQAVAFRLAVDTLQPIVSLDVGAKTIEANSCSKLTVGFVSDTNGVEGKASFNLATATAQYYAIDAENIRSLTADSSKAVYFVIYNDTEGDKGENVISITDIKVAYEGKPTIQPPADSPTDPEIKRGIWEETPPVRFLVDRNAATAAETFLKAILAEPPAEEEPPVEEPPVEEPPIVAEGIRILHSLNLASDISINYAVPKAELAGYENVVMTCTLPVYEGDGLMDLRQLTLLPVEQGDYLYFTLTGMTAVNMNDTVEAVLSMTKEGRDYTTAVDTYSVAQYAYAQLNKAYTDRALKVLCADLLRYGAKAQIFKSYRTDALADANMTAAHRAYLSDLASVTFGNTNKVLNDLENAPITWAGKSLDLDSKVALKFVFSMGTYTGELSNLTLRVSYKDSTGAEKTLTLTNAALYNPDRGYYAFTLDTLLAAELRSVVSVQIYAGDTPLSCTLRYSADTYGNNKTGTLLELCKALFAYSDSAKNYFQP